MKKPILLLLLFATTLLSAQNWMPTNVNDTRIHFLAKDSIPIFYGYTQPILSVVTSKVTQLSGGLALKFKKGYNNQVQSRQTQCLKAQMFGDSLFSSNNQSKFFTIDSIGFNIIFPHLYNLNDTFTIGISSSATLIGKVDSLYSTTINGAIDSVVYVSQTVLNSSGAIDTSHPFNNTYYKLSKSFGMLESINYSELKIASYYKQVFMNDTIKEQQNYPHFPGDEIVINENSTIDGLDDWNTYIYRIDSVSRQNNIKTIYYSIYESNFKPWLPPQPFIYTGIDSNTIDTTKLFAIMESNIIEDSCLQWPPNPYCFFPTVFDYSFSNGALNRLKISSYTTILTSGVDSIYTGPQLSGTFDNRKIGMWDENYQHGMSGNGSNRITKRLAYAKIGGKVWGTPPTILSIKELDKSNTSIYPNPTSDFLNLNANSSFDFIEIRNLSGQVVLKQDFSNQIDVSGFQCGIYIIRLIGEHSITEKFIKN
ncbi:MAG: T9SS type A sorting domain-containing protein [Flavobacteriales bacterium]|nr:T9SS type A sorting domain-containing protein [Flavobacteriales bacterium]